MAERKAFLLRLDPGVWAAVERLAQAELRSVNAEVEFLLREAMARRGIAIVRGAPRAEPTPSNRPGEAAGTRRRGG